MWYLNIQKNLQQEVLRLENELEVEKEKQTSKQVQMKDKLGHYRNNVWLAVLNLLRLEVATEKVGPVMQTVADNIFGCRIPSSEVPSR